MTSSTRSPSLAKNSSPTTRSATLMSGNRAFAAGAVDAGVAFVAAFPGGPTSTLVNALADEAAAGTGPHVQWSVNEKVAVEAAAGAAMGGVRAMAVMKHFGANNAADMIFASPLMFIGGLVIVVGDDPSGHTSHSEQDTRPYPIAADMPCLEASSPQEAYEIAGHAFELSEELNVPVYLRIVKWLSDWSAPVLRGDAEVPRAPHWDEHHYQSRPILTKHQLLHETLARTASITARWDHDRIERPKNSGPLGVVAAGNGYQLARDALESLGVSDRVLVLKLSTINPLPSELLGQMLTCDQLLVIEEIEPVVEERLASFAAHQGARTTIHGRATGALPSVGELLPAMVQDAIAKLIGDVPRPRLSRPDTSNLRSMLPARKALPVPGNAHRPTMHALRNFVERDPRAVFMGDVGEVASMGRDYMKAHSAMGAGIGMAIGAAASDPAATVVTVVGDGTLWGFSLNGVADAVYNNSRLLLLVADNATMESTGGQPTPTSPSGIRGGEVPLDIEATLRGLGVAVVERADPRDVEAVTDALLRASSHPGISAVITVAGPPAVSCGVRVADESGGSYRQQIEHFACPALGFRANRLQVDDALCVRCGDCLQIAPGVLIAEPFTGDLDQTATS